MNVETAVALAMERKEGMAASRIAALNARNREARARKGTRTGPRRWCSASAHRTNQVNKCPRCGPKPEYVHRIKGSTGREMQ